jgi:hypothetical protein
MAGRFLRGLLRRDAATSPDVARFFMENSVSPQPTIRADAQRCVVIVHAVFFDLSDHVIQGGDQNIDIH